MPEATQQKVERAMHLSRAQQHVIEAAKSWRVGRHGSAERHRGAVSTLLEALDELAEVEATDDR